MEVHVVAHVAAAVACPGSKVEVAGHQRPDVFLMKALGEEQALGQCRQPQVMAARAVVEQVVGDGGLAQWQHGLRLEDGTEGGVQRPVSEPHYLQAVARLLGQGEGRCRCPHPVGKPSAGHHHKCVSIHCLKAPRP